MPNQIYDMEIDAMSFKVMEPHVLLTSSLTFNYNLISAGL